MNEQADRTDLANLNTDKTKQSKAVNIHGQKNTFLPSILHIFYFYIHIIIINIMQHSSLVLEY